MISEFINLEDILNVYASNIRGWKYTKQKLIELQGIKDKSTIMVRDLNIPLSIIYRTCRHKINMDIVDISNTIHQLNMIDIYRTLHPMTPMFFSSVYETFYQHRSYSGP